MDYQAERGSEGLWKVIVVEDNEIVRESICKKIPWSSLEIEISSSFKDGKSAWDYMQEKQVDLVISDIVMPLMSGIDLAQNIFKNELSIKIILISAYNEFEYAKNAIRFGVSAYVTKPVEHDDLVGKVKEILHEIEENRYIQRTLEKSFPVIRNQFFDKLLNNTMNRNSFERDCQYLGLKFCNGSYRCFLLEPDSLYEEVEIKKRETVLYTLEKITKLKMKQYDENVVVFVYNMEQVVILAHFLISKKELYDALEEIRQKIMKRFSITVSVAIGSEVDKIYEVSISNRMAKEVLKQRFLDGGDKIFEECYNLNGRGDVPGFFYLSEEQFCDRIKYDSEKQVLEMLEELEKALYERESVCKSSKSWLLYLGAYLFKLWQQTAEDEISVAKKYTRFFEEISNQKTLKESFQVFSNQVMQICDAVDNARNRHKSSVVEAVKVYIGENYQDKGLGLDKIAENVYLSNSYLSSLFKKNTGQTITDYISKIRINQAKRLLVESDMKIAEIAERNGYINQFYFSSCFKKIVGVSPQEFRKGVVKGETG